MKKTAKQVAAEICKTPGEKIRSGGMGRGLARGKGKGPMGVPFNAKKMAEDIIAKVAAAGAPIGGGMPAGSTGSTPAIAPAMSALPRTSGVASVPAPRTSGVQGIAKLPKLPAAPKGLPTGVTKSPAVKAPSFKSRLGR